MGRKRKYLKIKEKLQKQKQSKKYTILNNHCYGSISIVIRTALCF